MKKQWVISLFLVSLFANSVFAKAISVQVIQNLPGQDKVWDATRLFEQSIIDYYFDMGNIVSNSPIWINSTEDKNRSALGAALIENSDGGMDYLIRFELFFKITNSSNPNAPLLENIDKVEWKIYSVESGKEISSGSGKPDKVTTSNNNESGITRFANFIAKKVEGQLKK